LTSAQKVIHILPSGSWKRQRSRGFLQVTLAVSKIKAKEVVAYMATDRLGCEARARRAA